MLTRRHLLSALAVTAGLATTALPALADKVTVTDIVGRKVEVDAPVKRIILGEGRQMYFVGALDRDEPFKRVVGWRDDLALLWQIFRRAGIFGIPAARFA